MLVTENVAQWKQDRLVADGAVVMVVPIIQVPDLPSREATYVQYVPVLMVDGLINSRNYNYGD